MRTTRPKKRRGPGRPRKDDSLGSKDDIRAKLIDAALEIVRDEGLQAVTTTRLMQAIGMTQSGFYQYFRNVEECLQAAAESFASTIREQMAAFRKQVWADAQLPLDDDAVRERFRIAFEYSLTVPLSQPGISELMMMFFRHRYDRSALGAALHQVSQQAREDMAQETIAWMKRSGIAKPDVAAVRVYAGFLHSLWAGALEMLLEDPKLDRRMVRDMLVRSAFAVYRANAVPSTPTRARKSKR